MVKITSFWFKHNLYIREAPQMKVLINEWVNFFRMTIVKCCKLYLIVWGTYNFFLMLDEYFDAIFLTFVVLVFDTESCLNYVFHFICSSLLGWVRKQQIRVVLLEPVVLDFAKCVIMENMFSCLFEFSILTHIIEFEIIILNIPTSRSLRG